MKTKIKIMILFYLLRMYLEIKESLYIIKADYLNFVYSVKKIWAEFKSQINTWDEVKRLLKHDWIEFCQTMKGWARMSARWLKKLPKRLYDFIDRGDPKWTKLRLRISFGYGWIKKTRRKNAFMKTILPDYYKPDGDWLFVFLSDIPKGSDALNEIVKIKKIMEQAWFRRVNKVKSDEDRFECIYEHEKWGRVNVYVYMDNKCDIEYKDEVFKKPHLVGICAKVLEELNSN